MRSLKLYEALPKTILRPPSVSYFMSRCVHTQQTLKAQTIIRLPAINPNPDESDPLTDGPTGASIAIPPNPLRPGTKHCVKFCVQYLLMEWPDAFIFFSCLVLSSSTRFSNADRRSEKFLTVRIMYGITSWV